jgi:hypothetical protein
VRKRGEGRRVTKRINSQQQMRGNSKNKEKNKKKIKRNKNKKEKRKKPKTNGSTEHENNKVVSVIKESVK